MADSSASKTTLILRWIARIWGTLMAGLVLIILLGHIIEDGIGPTMELTFRESLMMAAFVITWLGLNLAWKWERLGGILIVGGMIAFYLFDYLFSGSFPRGPIFLMIAGPGVVFLMSAVWDGRNQPPLKDQN